MLNDFVDFDASDITAIAVGFALALFGEPVFNAIRNKIDGKARDLKKPSGKHVMYVLVALALVINFYTMNQLQKEMTANSYETLQTAEAVCEEQKVRAVESQGQIDIFLKSSQAPERLLPEGDPEKQAWQAKLLQEYVGITNTANAKRAQLAEEFRTNPRTEPTCVVGK